MSTLKIEKISEDDPIGSIVIRDFTSEFVEEFRLYGEGRTCLPKYFEDYADDVKDFLVRDSDVIVASFPKTGTTWVQEMVWLIQNNLNYKGAEENLQMRFPFMDACSLFDCKKFQDLTKHEVPIWICKSLEFINKIQGVRFIKTHLPFNLLPQSIQNGSKSPKIIYVMRNPKDACVSYFHHGQLLEGWRASFEDFCKAYLDGKVLYGPYWENIFSYWKYKNLPNVLILKYEDMKKDLASVVCKVSDFLGKQLTQDQIEKLCLHLSFDSMKNNNAVNFHEMIEAIKKQNPNITGEFLRSGKVGKYKEEMIPEMINEFDHWTKNHTDGTDFYSNLKL